MECEISNKRQVLEIWEEWKGHLEVIRGERRKSCPLEGQ